MSDVDPDVRKRLALVLDQLPVEVERSLQGVEKRSARRRIVTSFATVGVAAAFVAAVTVLFLAGAIFYFLIW